MRGGFRQTAATMIGRVHSPPGAELGASGDASTRTLIISTHVSAAANTSCLRRTSMAAKPGLLPSEHRVEDAIWHRIGNHEVALDIPSKSGITSPGLQTHVRNQPSSYRPNIKLSTSITDNHRRIKRRACKADTHVVLGPTIVASDLSNHGLP